MKNSTIGILSGTFDPIHLGHTHLATTLHKNCRLGKIMMIPCHQSPLKQSPIASSLHRINMLKIATRNLPFVEIDDHETKTSGPSYTIKTLKHLHQQQPKNPLALIMGTDVFNQFDEWYKWEEILNNTHLLIADRPNHKQITNPTSLKLLSKRQTFAIEELQKKPYGLIYLTNIEPLPISATMIRNLIMQQKEAKQLLDPKVWEYITKNKLYLD